MIATFLEEGIVCMESALFYYGYSDKTPLVWTIAGTFVHAQFPLFEEALRALLAVAEAMICACLASVSDMAIIPLADWLHLGSEARINTPSTQGANWQWRLGSPMPGSLAAHIAQLTALYERTPCGE